jgi:peptidoglycan hydrolase CwlO-like protein
MKDRQLERNILSLKLDFENIIDSLVSEIDDLEDAYKYAEGLIEKLNDENENLKEEIQNLKNN